LSSPPLKEPLNASDEYLAKSAAALAVVVSLVLISVKALTWGLTDASSVLASLTDSSLDALLSFLSFLTLRYAFMPADQGHPFGHGKAESLIALLQAAFISGSALVLSFYTLERIYNPVVIQAFDLGSLLLLLCLLLTVALVVYQTWVSKKTGSLAIKADAGHYRADILATFSVLIAVVCARWQWYWLDPLVALAIILLLLKSAYDIAKASFNMLMDKSLGAEVLNYIHQCAEQHPDIFAIHDIKTRLSGSRELMQMHVELDGRLPLQRAHDIGEELAVSIKERYPKAEIIIHHDAVVLDNES